MSYLKTFRRYGVFASLFALSVLPAQAAITVTTTDIVKDIGTIQAAVIVVGLAWMVVSFAVRGLKAMRMS